MGVVYAFRAELHAHMGGPPYTTTLYFYAVLISSSTSYAMSQCPLGRQQAAELVGRSGELRGFDCCYSWSDKGSGGHTGIRGVQLSLSWTMWSLGCYLDSTVLNCFVKL